MKIYVITDDKGEILATGSAGSPGDVTEAEPKTSPGQKLHHIELPKELEETKDAKQLHHGLKAHMRS